MAYSSFATGSRCSVGDMMTAAKVGILVLPMIQLLHLPQLAQSQRIFLTGPLVSTPGETANFVCQPRGGSTSITNLQWLINETLVETLQLNATRTFEFGIGTLTFNNILLNYNGTRITCDANVNSDVSVTQHSILYVQGLLEAVSFLMITANGSNVSITWTPPFTLDISGVNPDITGYCITVTSRITSLTLNSQCGTNVTEFHYTLSPDSACNTYNFTVVPVNIVGNGTSATVMYSQDEEAPSLVREPVRVATYENDSSHTLEYILVMSTPVCSASLVFADLDAEEQIVIDGLIAAVNNISFTSEQLMLNRHYNITIMATNSNGSNTSYTKISENFIEIDDVLTLCGNIGTHDVAMVATLETLEKAIILETVYSEPSTASGALFSFVFITDSGDVDFSRSFLLALDRNTSHEYTLPFDLYPGHYRVYVYDIEHEGVLRNGEGYPAVMDGLFTNGTSNAIEGETYYQPFNCTLSFTPGLIWAECYHPNSSFAAGFQVIVQSTNVSEVQKLYVNQSMDVHTPVSVPVERDGEYRVSIFAIREGMGILVSTMQYMMGTISATSTVQDIGTTTLPQNDSTVTRGATRNGQNLLFVALGVVVAVLVPTILVGILILIVVYCKQRHRKQQSPLELNVYSTTEGLQEDTGLATTFSPVDVSANYCVVTGNHEVSPLYYGDVIAPQHHENANVSEDEQEQLETTLAPDMYSSLNHSVKPQFCENGNGHYSLLNHPTRSKSAKASGVMGQDLSTCYFSFSESSQSKKPEKQVLTTERKVTDGHSVAGDDVMRTQHGGDLYATVDLAAKKNRKLKQQNTSKASRAGEDCDEGLYDDVRPSKHPDGPSKAAVTDHDSNMNHLANQQNDCAEPAFPGDTDVATIPCVGREPVKSCDVDLVEMTTLSGPLNGYTETSKHRNKHDLEYEFVTISQPSVAASAGVLGDVDRVVYSDLRTISNDATARITSHKVADASSLPSEDHTAEGINPETRSEGKFEYSGVALQEDGTGKDPVALNRHGMEYTTVTEAQNKHKLNYTFVDPVPSSTATSAALGGGNKVVYSAVRPHDHHLGKPKDEQATSATSAHIFSAYATVDLSLKKKKDRKPKPLPRVQN